MFGFPAAFVRHNLLLFVVALVSGGMLLWPFVRRTSGGPWVTAAQATHLINREEAIVVDVREPNEYAAGHVLGAKNLPLARLAAGRPPRPQRHGSAPTC